MLKINVEKILEEKGKNQKWLAKQMGITQANLSRLTTNKTSKIRYENIEKLCNILECEPNDLFIKVDDPNEGDDDDDYWM